MLCRYELTYRLSISECMSSHSRKWRKEQPYILNPTFVLECYPNMKVTYNLSTSECMSSRSSKWRKVQSFIFNQKTCVRM